MADSRTGARNIQDESGTSGNARKLGSTQKVGGKKRKKKRKYHNDETLRGSQEPVERAPNGQIWNNLSKKINNVILDYNLKYKINICEPILI